MIKNQEVISAFLGEAAQLLNTSRQFSDIYRQIIVNNKKNVYAEYFNLNNKIKHYKYAKMHQNVKRFASYLRSKIKDSANSRIVLKVANSPAWGEIFWAVFH